MKRLELIVSLSAVCENARVLRGLVPPGVKMLAVVKADAYGHGARAVAGALIREGLCDGFCVATPGEGADLRAAGINAPIVVLGCADEESEGFSDDLGLSQAVCDLRGLRALNEKAKRLGKREKAHLKIDTGMTRIGVRTEAQLTDLLLAWREMPGVEMEGMFTHFCFAEGDEAFTQLQLARFLRAAALVKGAGFSPYLHAAASTALLRPDARLDAVRAGIALYGTGVAALKGSLSPAQTLVSHPVRVEWVQAGETVGYNRAYRCPVRMRVMTVPCGYGDGYPRILGGRADVLVNGARARVLGNVCMDMLMADVTDAGNVTPDSPVVLLGAQGNERVTPDELAGLADTIPYEIMLGFLPRVSRRWTDETT